MNYSTYRFTLDLRKHKSQMSIAVFRCDTAVRLCISLTDGGNPYYINDGIRAVFYGKRADGEPLIHPCMIKEQTEIVYDFEDTTSAIEGIVECEIRLYGSDNKLITAPRFIIVVDEKLVNDTDVDLEGSPISALDEIFLSENRRVEEHEQMRETVEGFSAELDTAKDDINSLEEKEEWDYVITSLDDFTTENLATMSGRVLVKGVEVGEYLGITVPSSIKHIGFIDSKFGYVNITAESKETSISGFVGYEFDTGYEMISPVLTNFGQVEHCTGLLTVKDCDNISHCQIRQAINCTNLIDIYSMVAGIGLFDLANFSECTLLDNIRIYNTSGHEVVEFNNCKHISNVHIMQGKDGGISYVNCDWVDGDTCDGYFTAEDNGKVQTVNTDGGKSLISVYSQDEIDTKLGDISTILTALHEGGVQ